MSDQYMEEFEKGWQMLMDQADPGANGAGKWGTMRNLTLTHRV
jgi:hypothetical protein